MLFFLVSFLSLLLLFSKSPSQMLSFFSPKLLYFILRRLQNCMLIGVRMHSCGVSMSCIKKGAPKVENAEETEAMPVLDLPELALDIILGKLSPSGLRNMAGVCSSLRDKCRSDHLWERHMREKWGRLIGGAARREWEWFMASGTVSAGSGVSKGRPGGWLGSLSCVWPLGWGWLKSCLDSGCNQRSYEPDNSILSWYLALDCGKFWFPAQVYNREKGHIGFMLSCYDAELSYDCHSDTFQARYPPHGCRTGVIEEGLQWDRIRAPPVDTCAHDLHVSDCLNALCPGDHVEIQWKKNKEFPYGWWYGVVGHLDTCDGNEYRCRCHYSDTVILEFNQYTPGSMWRKRGIERKNHREEGNETDGFYGGIRKLYSKEEIATWRRLWPTDVLE